MHLALVIAAALAQAPPANDAPPLPRARLFVSAQGSIFAMGPTAEGALEFGQSAVVARWLEVRFLASVAYSARVAQFAVGVGVQPIVWLGPFGLGALALGQLAVVERDAGPAMLTLLGSARLRIVDVVHHELSVDAGALTPERSFVVRAGYTVSFGAGAPPWREPLALRPVSFGLGVAIGGSVMSDSVFSTCTRCGTAGWVELRQPVPTLTVEAFASFAPSPVVELQPLVTVSTGAVLPEPGVLVAASLGLRTNIWYSASLGSGLSLACGASWHFAQVGLEHTKTTTLAPELTTLANVLQLRFERHRFGVAVGVTGGFNSVATLPADRVVLAPVVRLEWRAVF